MKSQYYKIFSYKDLQINLQDIFDKTAKENLWGDPDSISGNGSNLFQTRIVREALPVIISKCKIRTFLDAPCGDLFWMKEIIDRIVSEIDQYIGADLVNEIVLANASKFNNRKIKFLQLNLVSDVIPTVDLIFTRDCFIHLSFKNIYRILNNYKKSKSKYLLLSTYTSNERINSDINDSQLHFRALNMQKFPFSFSKPLLLINEGCTEVDGNYSDKSLALWEIKHIKLKRISLNIWFYIFQFQISRIQRKIKKTLHF